MPSEPQPSIIPDINWLAGGGEMAALIATIDWSRTPLGPIEAWPQSLRTTVSLCLSSTFPILVAWGPEYIQIYNDAYRPICGGKHPASMGEPFKICWATALPVVGDKFDRAQQGEGTYIKDQRMFLDRDGYLEEAFMTFSFSPIRAESGEVGGIFHPITETTAMVLNARRTQSLRDLSASIADARTVDDICRDLAAQYEQLSLDVPFLLFYQRDESDGKLHLRGHAGIDAGSTLAPQMVAMDDASWPFAQVAASGKPQQVVGLAPRFGGVACGPYEEAPDSALVLPISLPGQHEVFGFVVAGVSARRAVDDDYRNFYGLLTAAFNTAVGNVTAYEQEQRRAEELARIDRAKTAFFSNVSHEFRTPLTLILGPLDDALANDGLSPEQRRRIETTHRNALRLLKLVNSLLDFSRIEAGRVQASYQPVDLARLTVELASVFESAMAKGGLDYTLNLPPLTQPVYVDRDMWEKIVFNLLSNAFKFTLEGGVTLTLREHEGMARLSVQDTGGGIPEHELPRTFERFHRIEGAPGRTYEGSGIGLALIQELVRLHGGQIAVHSVVGEGTRFDVDIPFGHVHLPAERVVALDADPVLASSGTARTGAAFVEEALRWLPEEDENLPQQRAESGGLLSPGLRRPRILIADDNNDMRAYLKSLLDPHADVTMSADGEAAFERLQHEPCDLLLSDVMMPRLDGFGLIARIRADETLRHLPVILLSARAGEEAKIEGLQAGADDYLVKPFSTNELLARVLRQVTLAGEREQQRQDALLREAYFHALIDASPVMLWTTDASGQTTYLSQRWYDYTGRTPQQDLGDGWLDNVHPDDAPHVMASFTAARAASAPYSVDFRLRRADGSYCWCIDAGMPRMGDDGKAVGFVGTVIDIHARKVLQERFERVAGAGDIGVWHADAPFAELRINAQMAAHLGLDGQLSATVAQVLAVTGEEDRTRLAAGIARSLREGAPMDLECCVMRVGAAPRWLRAVGWCDVDDHGQPTRFDGIILDISIHKNAELELQRLAGELTEKNRRQSEFLFTLAHELRNPLAPIRAGLELMAASPGPVSGDLQGMMRRQVDHMVHLVDDLLDIARLTEGKVTLRRERVMLADVVSDAVEISAPLVRKGGHQLALHLPDASLMLDVDRHRIAQVLSNLLNNAAKYTPDNGKISLSARVASDEVVLEVEDNGIGIAPDLLATIFDMYAQVEAGQQMAQGGLGVGLNLVRQIVQLHGGVVSAHSEGTGQGSRFTVRLPLPVDAQVALAAPAAPLIQAAEVHASGLRVLVVDDNVDAAETLCALLEFSGHQVQVVHSGEAALASAAAHLPQVVLLDIGLPDISGYEAALALRDIEGMAGAKIIALTGWGTPADKQRSSDAGFDQHLTKPVDFTELLAALVG
ncbi:MULTISPECIES: ATP-binding protein [unclassified Duganella]|uniref:ATP-binding protein n=1 Tax=unclassified Duganella TaxID=2636909 RepID=UPI00088AC433|nr:MULTISPECIES: ATP-binding protein [unclassified Duganella]SDF75288.1 PAS domain S-box-containing protein [Duganella sp. OV458]SDI54300.1 PAS domain S-box-containing protein [Duganella sp. OV510]